MFGTCADTQTQKGTRASMNNKYDFLMFYLHRLTLEIRMVDDRGK